MYIYILIMHEYMRVEVPTWSDSLTELLYIYLQQYMVFYFRDD